MKLDTEVITPSGSRIKPYVKVGARGWNAVQHFDLFHGNFRLGQVRIIIENNCLFIKGMDNFTSGLPLTERYQQVGRALHEIVFLKSVEYGLGGRVELIADKGAGLFHMKCGFAHSEPGKTSQVVATLQEAENLRVSGLPARIHKWRFADGPMFLPPEVIQQKLSPKRELSQPEKVPTFTAVLSPAVSHPVYQKLAWLVSTGQISSYNANQLINKLLHPSHPGDKETWSLILSPPGLKAMALQYFDGWVVGIYFSQYNSSKLKYMLSREGMYAFSQFLIGWQNCSSMYDTTLQFIFSDYGILALEGYIKPEELHCKSFCEKTLSQHSYDRIRFQEMTLDALQVKPVLSLKPLSI